MQQIPNVHCLIVGKGENEEELKQYVEQHELKHIHFLGFRCDIPLILSDSDIVTLLSFREGLPRCVMEAMASKKPLVVTNIRGSRDLVQHGINGFVVDLEDDQALIESFIKLIRDPKLREDMGRASFERIQPYRLENVLAEMEDVYSRYVKALEKVLETTGVEAYNLGTGRGYSVLEVVAAFERVTGVKIPYTVVDRRLGDVAVCYADPTKAKKELGWVAARGIEDMCRDAWRWQSQNPNGYERVVQPNR